MVSGSWGGQRDMSWLRGVAEITDDLSDEDLVFACEDFVR